MTQSDAAPPAAPLGRGIAPLAAEPAPQHLDEPLAGILIVLSSMVIFSISDATTKYLSVEMSAIEIAWLRYVTFVALLLPLVLRQGRKSLVSSRPGLQLLRSLGLLGSSLFFIAGLHYLPIADATVTTFIAPLITTALSIVFLGEKVGVRRWTALAVGLAGVVIVIRPGTGAFNPASILPILSAISWSASMVITRRMAGADGTLAMLAYSAGVGFVALSFMLPFAWTTPSPAALGLGVMVGVASSVGQWLVILAYRRAAASVLAPFSYTQLIWSTLSGILVFATVPDLYTVAGAAVIVASGLYTAHRERTVARSRGARAA